MDVFKEITAIRKLLDSSNHLNFVRREASKALKDECLVADGEHYGLDFDCVILHEKGKRGDNSIKRRFASYDLESESVKVDDISKNVVGINFKTRRGSGT